MTESGSQEGALEMRAAHAQQVPTSSRLATEATRPFAGFFNFAKGDKKPDFCRPRMSQSVSRSAILKSPHHMASSICPLLTCHSWQEEKVVQDTMAVPPPSTLFPMSFFFQSSPLSPRTQDKSEKRASWARWLEHLLVAGTIRDIS